MVIHRSYLFNYAICYLVLVEYLLVRRILTINIFPLHLVSLELRTQFIENSRKLFYTTDLIYIYKSYNRRNAALNLSRMLYRFVTKNATAIVNPVCKNPSHASNGLYVKRL